MKHHDIESFLNTLGNILMGIGTGSVGAYTFFEKTSQFCRDLCPIISVVTFALYIIINWEKIKAFFSAKKKDSEEKKI